VDVAKRFHWMQAMRFNGISIGKAFNIKNTKEGFESLVAKIEQLKQVTGCHQVIVGMEPTGHYLESISLVFDAKPDYGSIGKPLSR
jgi:transposase